MTRGKPHFRPAPFARGFLCSLLATLTVVFTPPAKADIRITDGSPEGFSISMDGLPETATDAWHATVLVSGRTLVWRHGIGLRWRIKNGSGVVVSIDEKTKQAVVATNAHAVSCGDQLCSVGVGFSDPQSPNAPRWAESVRVVSRDMDKDIAFIEVEIPVGVETRAARFGTAECAEANWDRVISIGWPDLSVRQEWGVAPPSNRNDHVKRHSDGYFLLWKKGRPMRPGIDRLTRRSEVVFHNADILPGSSGGPLLNEDGEVVGINTMIVSSTGEQDDHRFCARLDPHDPGECIHVAIASGEVISEFGRLYSSRIAMAGCSSQLELEIGR
jgi:S1-C subfamily serine protease